MKEYQWRNYSFLGKNRKCTWSVVQRLAITHPKYYVICENVHELSFLKNFRWCGIFKKIYQILGQRWNWGENMIEVDPAAYARKACLLLPVPFHLHAQMFKQPGLVSAVLSHIPGFTGPLAVLGWCPHSWYRAFLNALVPAATSLTNLNPLYVLARDSIHNEAPGVPWKGFLLLLLHSTSSLGSSTLQSCAYEYIYIYKYFSLAVWRKYTLV